MIQSDVSISSRGKILLVQKYLPASCLRKFSQLCQRICARRCCFCLAERVVFLFLMGYRCCVGGFCRFLVIICIVSWFHVFFYVDFPFCWVFFYQIGIVFWMIFVFFLTRMVLVVSLLYSFDALRFCVFNFVCMSRLLILYFFGLYFFFSCSYLFLYIWDFFDRNF